MAKNESLGLEESLEALAKEFHAFAESVEEQTTLPDEDEKARNAAAIGPYVGGPPEKRDRVALFIHRLEAEAEFYQKEANRREARAHRFKRLAERLKFSIKTYMEVTDIVKAEGRTSVFSIRRNPPSVKVIDPDRVPEEFCRIERVPDKNKIAAGFAAGKEVPGACLVSDSTRLVID